MLLLDRDASFDLALAAVFILGMAMLIASILILGLVLFNSWEAEWLLRR